MTQPKASAPQAADWQAMSDAIAYAPEDIRDAARIAFYRLHTLTTHAASAQVSDADVIRACNAYFDALPVSGGESANPEAMRAALEAAQPQPGRVEGMVLVPVEADNDMMDAGVKAAGAAPLNSDGLPGYAVTRAAWNAMIATAGGAS